MAGRRESIDIRLKILKPDGAREFIKSVDWGPLERPKYIVFGIDDKIHLDNMSDSEAVIAAHHILQDVVIPELERESQYEKWGH